MSDRGGAPERTDLAWVRTSLSLVAAGVAAERLAAFRRDHLVELAGAVAAVLAIGLGLAAWRRHVALASGRHPGTVPIWLVLSAAGAVCLLAAAVVLTLARS